MGPRLDRRGNLEETEKQYDKTAKLQWGHAWIGVGIGSRGWGQPASPRSFNGATPG